MHKEIQRGAKGSANLPNDMLRMLKAEVKEAFQCSLICELLKCRTSLPLKDICKAAAHIKKCVGNWVDELRAEKLRREVLDGLCL